MKHCITDKDFPFAVKYGILPEQLSTVLKCFEDKIFNENEVLKTLERDCPLPSRELFWSVLESKQILTHVKTFCIIDMKRLNCVDPSLFGIVYQLKETPKRQQNEIWMYQQNEIDYSVKDYILVTKITLIAMIGVFKYKQLINKSIVHLNKLATLQEVGDYIQFDQFGSLKKEDFLKIGISLDIASHIICELKEQCIIEQNKMSGQYMLLGDSNKLVGMELSKYKGYTDDVSQLLNVCFSFKIALENLRCCRANNEKLFLSLPIQPHKKIIYELYEHEVVSKNFINVEVNISKTLEKIYPKEMPKHQYKNLFEDLYDERTASSIVDYLISNKVLVEIKKNGGLYLVQVSRLQEISEHPYTETIKLILQRQVDLGVRKGQRKKIKDHIEEIVNRHASILHCVETPTFSLKLLSNELKENKLPLSECGIFSLNGLKNILVLEEKKYTTKMLVSSICVAVLGLAKIAAGVAMSMLLISRIWSKELVSEGINDIVYSISCFYSGNISMAHYIKNKCINLTLSAFNFLRHTEIYQSAFGTHVSSQSFSSVLATKSTCSDSTVDSMATLAQQVFTQIAIECSKGLTCIAVDNILEAELKRLGEELLEHTTGDINDIDGHDTINHIKTIYVLLGETYTKKIIDKCFTEVLNEYKVKYQNNWEVLCFKLIKTINEEFSYLIQQLKNKNMSLVDSGILIVRLIDINNKVNDIIKSGKNLIPNHIIPKIMNSMEQKLRKKLDELRTETRRQQEAKSNPAHKEKFILNTIHDFKTGIKSLLAENIHLSIVNPLLGVLKTKSGEYLMKMGSEQGLLYKEESLKDLIKHNKLKYKILEFWQGEKTKKLSKEDWNQNYYNECLMELFKKKRSISIFLEILTNSFSVDGFFMDLCCSVIPFTLIQEGFNVPMLKVVVEKNGKQYIYGGNVSAETNVLTIKITPDENSADNLKHNKIAIRNVLDIIYKKIVQLNIPESKYLTSEMLENTIIKAVKNNSYVQQYIIDGTTKIDSITKTSVYRSKGIQQVTKDANSQESKLTAGVMINTQVQKVKDLPHSQVVKLKVTNVFKTALAKINHHLQSTQRHFKSFKLTLGDFNDTKHVIISNNTLGRCFDYYATEYKLTIPLMEADSELYDYNVTMSLHDQSYDTHQHFSIGPRVEYTILPANLCQTKHFENCIKGHILVDVECNCIDKIYSINECHSAGELVLSSL